MAPGCRIWTHGLLGVVIALSVPPNGTGQEKKTDKLPERVAGLKYPEGKVVKESAMAGINLLVISTPDGQEAVLKWYQEKLDLAGIRNEGAGSSAKRSYSILAHRGSKRIGGPAFVNEPPPTAAEIVVKTPEEVVVVVMSAEPERKGTLISITQVPLGGR